MLDNAILGLSRSAVGLRARIAAAFGIVVVLNVGSWLAALTWFHQSPFLLAAAGLAYSFGLRHAVDADHIAAIDNVTRKLLQEGQRPAAVGLFFSLGHSTVVVALSVLIALTSASFAGRYLALKTIGGVVGASISGLFLLAIAVANGLVLLQVARALRRQKRQGAHAAEDPDRILSRRGILGGAFFRHLFKLIDRSWHMFPLGFLFGLGFDTATEVGLLGLTASQAAHGLPIWSILIFPALFTAGMSLLDTADGVLMLGAYRWALIEPGRKLRYNLAVTSLSVAVAAFVGGTEVLGLIGDRLKLQGLLWDFASFVSRNLSTLGCAIVALFALTWIAAVTIWRPKGPDDRPALLNTTEIAQ